MQFHLLSFEGPDPYSRAGGIASRITGLSEALSEEGFDTHLWFIGDSELPGHESRGTLHLHRWCQWISRFHPAGVYAGEHDKVHDYSSSLPPYLFEELLARQIGGDGRAVVLAEEWHTTDAVLHLDWLLREARLRDRVQILWNANNTFGFECIDWQRLNAAATITTVSRYMKHLMWQLGVDPLVIPNGIDDRTLEAPPSAPVAELEERTRGRTLLAKVARFDPDKRWLLAIDIVAELRRKGERPLLVARGGIEEHAHEVMQHAREKGLRVSERSVKSTGADGVLEALEDQERADVISLSSPLDAQGRAVLFRGAGAVLANSGHEPFGLVGLETMAVGGLACTGCSGEDYAVPGQNALVLERNDPAEFVDLFRRLRAEPNRERAVRRAGRRTARQYTWRRVIARTLLPRLEAD